MYRNRLKDLREDRDLKQAALAEYLQIHQTTYSDYELGRLNIPINALHKLADYSADSGCKNMAELYIELYAECY